MKIVPVINCDDFNCVRKKMSALSAFLPEEERLVHIDISDGKYAVKPEWNDPTSLFLLMREERMDFKIAVHFMMEYPLEEMGKWAPFGIFKAAIPIDCGMDIREIALWCRDKKIIPCLSVPPPVEKERILKYADSFGDFQVLAVNPGPSGQKMSEDTEEKISFIRKSLPSAIIEVDGGVELSTIPLFKKAGADIALSGSFIFRNGDVASAYNLLIKAAA